MGFVIKQSDSYVWPVSIDQPADGGRHEKSTFDIEFKRISQSRIDELVEGGQTGAITDRQTCEELVIGWKGVTDGNDEIPFSQKSLAMLLDIPGVSREIVMAWVDSLSGAKRKN